MAERNQQWPDNIPWNVKLFIHALSFGLDITRRSDGIVNRCLMSFFDIKASPSKKPIKGVMSADITVDKARNLWFRLYTPTTITTDDGLPVIFFFHGGGFAYMSANSKPYNDFCYQLARELSAIIISVSYRLAPEHRCPTQYEDCFDTMRFIDSTGIEQISSIANLKQCFIAGDSAGGNLVHHVAVKASEYEFSNIKLIGNIVIQSFFGGEERTESELRLTRAPFVTMERADWMWKVFLPEGSNRDHWAANVFGPNSLVDISGVKFPATIVFVGGFDPLQDWQKRYYEALKKFGKEAYLVEYPNAFHTFYAYPEVAEASLFLKEVKNFMQKQSAIATNI
ncbi:Arylacetamide deacetylase, putative [Ricinus communis]|uniref:Arylacetamide deacetylase, putative n=2 Tax=Ricinus communis TaxID=3988 RepID=B9SBX1_RICCO|nr:Arylacetamide deacetylase, putative [Ricinus communis]